MKKALLASILLASSLAADHSCDYKCGNANGCDAAFVEDGNLVVVHFRYGDMISGCAANVLESWLTTENGWIKVRHSFFGIKLPQWAPKSNPIPVSISLIGLDLP